MKNWSPEEINNLRGKYKLSQPAFGNLLGVSGNYIYLLEKGVKTPSRTLRLLLNCVERQSTRKRKEKETWQKESISVAMSTGFVMPVLTGRWSLNLPALRNSERQRPC